ncbi:MAG: relaxase/mobilization nuclease domain-containing protein, partial [Eubacterium sp.]|nr:relaxase/mobilization nuclease domain-containing protein [Eubacterium sp.]
SYILKRDTMNLLYYIAVPAEICSGYGISLSSIETVFNEFEYIKKYWNKAEEGRRQVRHLIVSFEDPYISLDVVGKIAWEIGGIYGKSYQVFYGVHTDTTHTHIHYAINTVSFVDGKMFSEGVADYIELNKKINEIEQMYR